MPSIKPGFYRQVRKEYNEMFQSFTYIEEEYNEFKETYEGDLYQMMYSISDFYNQYSSLVNSLDSLLKSQELLTKQDEYNEMKANAKEMISSAKSMYKEVKILGEEYSGGFSDSEYRGISRFIER